MSRLRFDVTTITKVFTSILLIIALVSAAGLIFEQGLSGLVQAVPLLYITGVLFVGVFRDATRTRWWRAAFFGGVVVWSLTDYFLGGSDQFSLLLALAGSVMVVAVAYEYLQARE